MTDERSLYGRTIAEITLPDQKQLNRLRAFEIEDTALRLKYGFEPMLKTSRIRRWVRQVDYWLLRYERWKETP